MTFSDKLVTTIAQNQSLLFVGLDPNLEMLPERFRQSDHLSDLRNWLLWVIAETQEWVCAYKPTLGFYQALGPSGLQLLEQVLEAIPAHIPVILDAKHGDLNTSTAIAHTAFAQWNVDAITLTPYSGQDLATPFLVYPGKAVFVLSCTANSAAIALQQSPADSPLYERVVQEARAWGTPEQLGLEVGTTSPTVLGRVRTIAPERLVLARSLWQGGDLSQLLIAGLDRNGAGLLIPVPQDLLRPDRLAEVFTLRHEVNQFRQVQQESSCEVWTANICTVDRQPHLDLILQLFDVGCIMFGEFVQASGAVFPYYIDLRKIISNPQLFHQVLSAYAEILQGLNFDRIAGIPYGSLPTATGLVLHLNVPMIFPRKEVKAHGTRRMVEGNFHPGETVVVVDDILISGNSAIEGAAKLESVGLQVKDIVVLLDHEQGVKDRLQAKNYRGHSVLTISEVTSTLHQAGRITDQQFEALTE
ncbi:MAG TPA: bifunctional orotidine-5'-phosphate decarboxylase/orotate phosphoribosyltransferase [Thermosynechococcaceae cyanobacterium]